MFFRNYLKVTATYNINPHDNNHNNNNNYYTTYITIITTCTGEQPKIGDFNLIKYKGSDGSKKRLHILSKASHRWKDVATTLFPEDTSLVNNLSQKHRDNPTDCLRELLQDFLTKGLPDEYTRDWNGIIELFTDLDEAALAKEIKEAVLNKGK